MIGNTLSIGRWIPPFAILVPSNPRASRHSFCWTRQWIHSLPFHPYTKSRNKYWETKVTVTHPHLYFECPPILTTKSGPAPVDTWYRVHYAKAEKKSEKSRCRWHTHIHPPGVRAKTYQIDPAHLSIVSTKLWMNSNNPNSFSGLSFPSLDNFVPTMKKRLA